MAFGVNQALPSAKFLHAKSPEDIARKHLEDIRTFILVDSVINSGKTVVDFVQHVWNIQGSVRIVVVAGVVQSQAVDKLKLIQGPRQRNRVTLVTLRLSDNKFTGKGATDTGNRLFNTTNLD